MTSYSLEDASSDAECILRDFQCDFVVDNWMNVSSFQSSILGTKSSPPILPSLCHQVSDHIDNIKYLKFASAALDSSASSSMSIDARREISTAERSSSLVPPLSLKQTDFLEKIPFTTSVHELAESNDNLREVCCSEITLKQLQKDIERDELVIDGERIVGSNVGLDYCLGSIKKSLDNCLGTCFLPALGTDLRDEMSRTILATACRTNSGGIALHVLRTITDTEDVMLIPRSTEAGSLLIKISVGQFFHIPNGNTLVLHESKSDKSSTDSSQHPDNCFARWGLRAEVRASTVYDVASMEDAMQPDLDPSQSGSRTIEVIYENCVCLAIDSRTKVMNAGEVLGGGGKSPSGRVSFRHFEAFHERNEG